MSKPKKVGVTPDPLKPSATLLIKLGSLAVHAEELLSPKGHQFDRAALDTCLQDAEVQAWLKEMGALALLPLKR